MSKKSAKRVREAAPVGDGMVAHFIDRAFENPAMSGGLMVMALTASAIISNAMFLQNGRHPDPLFMPRPAPVLWYLPRPAPAPSPPASIDAREIAMPPLPRLAPTTGTVAAPSAALANPANALTMEIQRELARLGLYNGAIDGIAGSRTAAAIAAYELAAGRARTGKATPELLVAMKTPLPSRDAGASVAQDAGAAAMAAELDRRERERAERIAAEQRTAATAQLQATYLVIQGALNRIGYGPIAVDGSASADTADAIRRFELDNGLPITGEASDRLIGRLTSIGAIKTT